MKKKLLVLITIISFCLPLIAEDNMCVRLKNGNIISYSISDIEEVFFCDSIAKDPIVDTIPSVNATAVDTSGSILEFVVLTDSTAEVRGIASGIYGEIKEKIVIPSKVLMEGEEYTVTSIEKMAFFMTGVTSIEIPSTVTYIGEDAFHFCHRLNSIKVASDNPNYCTEDDVLYDKNKTVLIHVAAKKTGHFIIPSSVIRIENRAFLICRDLAGVTIPSSVKSIGIASFMQCSSFKEIVIPSSVALIDTGAFAYCDSLKMVEISNICDIKSEAFNFCARLESVDLPWGLSNIEMGLFWGCSSLKKLKIPTTVTSIDASAFKECSSLTDIVIPSGVTSIGNSAFEGCVNLTSLNIPSNLTTIGNSAFEGCVGLTNIEISDNVERIGHEAFSDCTNLDVVIDNSPYGILLGIDPFLNCKSVTYKDENTVVEEYDTPFEFTDIVYYWETVSIKGVNPEYYDSESMVIPAKVIIDGEEYAVTGISDNAFSECKRLQEVKIPMTIESIGSSVFEGCDSLENIFIPSSVTYFNSDSFANCSNVNVVIDNSRDSVYLDDRIYSDCKSVTFTYIK